MLKQSPGETVNQLKKYNKTNFLFQSNGITKIYESTADSDQSVHHWAAIGHLHDGVILLQLPEFISFSFSNSNFVIPGENKEQ